MPPEPPAAPFTVLAVCTGNICRSPAVERLLALELGLDGAAVPGPGPQVVVTSAGVRAVVGAPIPVPMATLVESTGARSGNFAARQLTGPMVRDADLVLALTRRHRSHVVGMHPAAVRRTFTLRELARLAAAVDPADLPGEGLVERLRALVPLAASQRGRVRADPDQDDVVDPYGGSDELYARSFAELAPAVATIARVLRG